MRKNSPGSGTAAEAGYSPLTLEPLMQQASDVLVETDHGTGPVRQEEAAEQDEEDERQTFDIPTDAYGAAILAIVRDFQKVLSGDDVVFFFLQTLVSMGLILLNLILQLGMVYFIKTFVVQTKVFEVQLQYAKFHQAVFDSNGVLQKELWDEYPDKFKLCQVGPSKKVFYHVTLFIWIITMVKELRKCLRLITDIRSVLICKDREDMLEETPGDEPGDAPAISIVAVTTPVKIALYVLVCLPKTFICLILMFEGMEWLTATTKFEDLVMNAVAMDFVLNIDELLYQVVLPDEKKTEVEDIDFKLPTVKESKEEEKRREESEMRTGYRDSVSYVGFAIFFVFFYSQFLQNVLPPDLQDVKEVCSGWMAHNTPICTNNVLKQSSDRFLEWMSNNSPGFIYNMVESIAHLAIGSLQDGSCYPFGNQEL